MAIYFFDFIIIQSIQLHSIIGLFLDPSIVYFDQQMGALHAVRWLKSYFLAFNTFSHHKCKKKNNCQKQNSRPAFWCKLKKHVFCKILLQISGFFSFLLLNQRLECAAPKCWLKYTTLT